MSGRITVPMAVYTAEVVATEDLSPTLRRVVLGGQGLAGYRTTGVGDEYIRLLFPAEGTKEPVLPTITAGALDYGSIDLNLLRTYTVRRFDADRGQVTVDFVVHGHGVATTWARRAIPGDLVGLNSPTGLYDPPADLAWQVLVADLAGLPALARLLEQTPRGCAPEWSSRCRGPRITSSCRSAPTPRSVGCTAATEVHRAGSKRSSGPCPVRTARGTSGWPVRPPHCGPSGGICGAS